MFRDINCLFTFPFVLLVPPTPPADQTLCLIVDVPTDFVTLDCTPDNPDEPSDRFMYQWTRGTTDLAFPQSVYYAFEIGTYTCTVSNTIGSATTMFIVVGKEMLFLNRTF